MSSPTPDLRLHDDADARGLCRLRQEVVDLRGHGAHGLVGALGEHEVAPAALGERAQHLLVVPQAQAHGGRAHRSRAAPAATSRSRAASVTPAFAWPSDGESGVGARGAGGSAGLLQPAERTEADRLVDPPAWTASTAAWAASVGERRGRQGDQHLVVERDEAEAVGRVQPLDQGVQSLCAAARRSPCMEPLRSSTTLQRLRRPG